MLLRLGLIKSLVSGQNEKNKKENKMEIRKISGSWSSNESDNFSPMDAWEAEVLLNENGWFEGIAFDINPFTEIGRFVYGIYHPDNVIKLFRFWEVGEVSPFILYGENESSINGMEILESKGENGEQTQIKVESVFDDSTERKDALALKIQEIKSQTLYGGSLKFYSESFAVRDNLSAAILETYKNSHKDDLKRNRSLEENKDS